MKEEKSGERERERETIALNILVRVLSNKEKKGEEASEKEKQY